MHSGFEPSAVEHAFGSLRGLGEMLRALVLGPRVPAAEPRSLLPSLAPIRAPAGENALPARNE